ncbi:hypothetical protein LTR85_009766 [Meristemomyces frigidus]|nr:hypothetical protein LTR85_009766 [Meristemomyces frigidus]
MQKADEHSRESIDAATFGQQHQHTGALDDDDSGFLQNLSFSNGLPSNPYQGLEFHQQRQYEIETAKPSAHAAIDGQLQMRMSNQTAQGTHGHGLPAYRSFHLSEALDATSHGFSTNAGFERAQHDLTDFFNSPDHRPPPRHHSSEPSTYHLHGSEVHQDYFEDFQMLRPYESTAGLAGQGAMTTDRPPAALSQQPRVFMQRQETWAQSSRADAIAYFKQAGQSSVGTGLATITLSEPQPDGPGVSVEQSNDLRRIRNVGRRSANPQASRPRDKFQCVECLGLGRDNVYIHTDSTGDLPGQERCRKHQLKWLKEQASTQVPVYRFDNGISSFENAKTLVYPAVQALLYDGEGEDDFQSYRHAEDEWIRRFINAANLEFTDARGAPQPRNEDQRREHEHLLKQQDTYNHKPHEKSSKDSYTNEFFNIRMRFLFRAILTYHEGGPAIYPVGGSNGGYGEDTTLPMSKRLESIEDILKQEKRVVMDVIEGRGVLALAANPKHYMDRKQSNNKCNTKKKSKFAIADAVEAGQIPTPSATIGENAGENGEQEQDGQDATPTPVRGRGKGKRKAGLQGQRGAASKRRTATEASLESTQEYSAPPAAMTHAAVEDGDETGTTHTPTSSGVHDESCGVHSLNAVLDEFWQQPTHAQEHNDHDVAPVDLQWQHWHATDAAAPTTGLADMTSSYLWDPFAADSGPEGEL